MRKLFLVGLVVATLTGCGNRFIAYGTITKHDYVLQKSTVGGVQ